MFCNGMFPRSRADLQRLADGDERVDDLDRARVRRVVQRRPGALREALLVDVELRRAVELARLGHLLLLLEELGAPLLAQLARGELERGHMTVPVGLGPP